MYRITSECVEQLRDHGYDVWIISLWETWLTKVPELESVIIEIGTAFENVTLGDGIGLREANAIDEYASDAERETQRELDEKHYWRNIDSQSLNENYVAPTYFDPRGFHFHLPAFLIAELKGEFDFCFVDRLVENPSSSKEWIGLLDDSQANAIINLLELLKNHPDYYSRTKRFDRAIARIRDRHITNAG